MMKGKAKCLAYLAWRSYKTSIKVLHQQFYLILNFYQNYPPASSNKKLIFKILISRDLRSRLKNRYRCGANSFIFLTIAQ